MFLKAVVRALRCLRDLSSRPSSAPGFLCAFGQIASSLFQGLLVQRLIAFLHRVGASNKEMPRICSKVADRWGGHRFGVTSGMSQSGVLSPPSVEVVCRKVEQPPSLVFKQRCMGGRWSNGPLPHYSTF